jgi:hypothetical protein
MMRVILFSSILSGVGIDHIKNNNSCKKGSNKNPCVGHK